MCKEGASLQPNKLEFRKRRHNNEIYEGWTWITEKELKR